MAGHLFQAVRNGNVLGAYPHTGAAANAIRGFPMGGAVVFIIGLVRVKRISAGAQIGIVQLKIAGNGDMGLSLIHI